MTREHPPFALGIDIGGTNMSAAIVRAADNAILCRETILTQPERGADDGMARLVALMRRVMTGANIEIGAMAGIGIGCTGPVDTERGLIQNPYTLPTWDDLPIVQRMAEAFRLPVLLLNDAHAAALAEHAMGAGRGAQNMVYVTISTGIGGGLILNNRLYRGARMTAGEIGHHTIQFEGRPCYCGARGCWEMYAAGPAIAADAQTRVTPESRLWELVAGETSAITARHVGEAAALGDLLAQTILHEAGRIIGVGVANLINIFAPDVIVLGGGVMNSHPFLLPGLHEVLGNQRFMVAADAVRIERAHSGLNAGVLGAARGLMRWLDDQL